MHILIIPPSVFLTKLQPLNGIFQLHQARALSNSGYKVGVLSVGFITPRYVFKEYNYIKIETIEKFKVYRNYRRLLFPWRFLPERYIISSIEEMVREIIDRYILEEGRPDIVHVHNILHAGIVGLFLKENYKIPFIITEHSSRYENGNISVEEYITINRIVKHSSDVTAVSTNFCNALSRFLNRQVRHLPNLIDPNFLNLDKELTEKPKHKNFTFFNAASLDTNKNHSLLLNSFAKSFKGMNIYLRIAGEGSLLKKLQAQTKQLGIQDQVEFLGRLPHAQIRNEMISSHCFILTSNYETFGVVLIEALSCGTPVIASNCGGPSDIVKDKVGFLFEPRNEYELSDCMRKMVEHAVTFKSSDLILYAEKHFGSVPFIERYQKLLDTI